MHHVICLQVKIIVSQHRDIWTKVSAECVLIRAWILCFATLVLKRGKQSSNMRFWGVFPEDVVTFCSEINRWQVITIYILLMTGVLQMLSHSRRWLGPPLVASQQWQMREAVQWRRSANTGKQRLQAFCVFVSADVSVCFRLFCTYTFVCLYLLWCITCIYLHFVQACCICCQGIVKLQ